jgi:peptidoglycan/LPS O-acetylase OafA/YrhL
MFGLFRSFLALLVVMSHLADQVFFQLYGMCAVFGFYVISGYLITRILNDVYLFNLRKFWLNRALRLYPVYLFILIFSWFFILLFRGQANDYFSSWGEVDGLFEIIKNVLIFPLAIGIRDSVKHPIILPAWSVAVELICYFILSIFSSRSRRNASITFLLSAFWHLFVIIMRALGNKDWGFDDIYFPFYAAMLPFSAGALIFFNYSKLKILQQYLRLDLMLFLWLCIVIFSHPISEIFKGGFYVVFYLNLFLIGILVVILVGRNSNRIDKWFGDLAYPIFLSHYIVHFVVILTIFGKAKNGLVEFLISLPFTFIVSICLARFAELTIEPIRNGVRAGANK